LRPPRLTSHGRARPFHESHITLELFNAASYPLQVVPGMRICQVTYHRHDRPATVPYGEGIRDKYQEQNGVTVSRLYEDFDDE
jgi:dCTP deaminase